MPISHDGVLDMLCPHICLLKYAGDCSPAGEGISLTSILDFFFLSSVYPVPKHSINVYHINEQMNE